MAGLQSFLLLAVIICIAIYTVYCTDPRDDLIDDYPATLIDGPELGELLERDKIRGLINQLQMRKKKNPSCLISPGAASCNTEQAIQAVYLNRLAAELGRRKRHLITS